MNNKQIIDILVCIKVTILSLVSIASIAYALPICFIRRFHTHHHLLSLNISITLFVCVTFWAIYLTMTTWYFDVLWTAKSCLVILYLQTMVNNQVTYGLCAISLNRLCTIVYHQKPFFRRKKWAAICICTQWICGAILPLTQFGSSLQQCFQSGLELGYQIYVLFTTAIIPAIFLAVIHTSIFIFAHRSTNRVYPMNQEHGASVARRNQRNTRLLKHMLSMFATFFIGWVPIYIIGVVYWNGTAISYVAYHGIQMLPMTSFIINIIDLFLYNHDLRAHLVRKLSDSFNGQT